MTSTTRVVPAMLFLSAVTMAPWGAAVAADGKELYDDEIAEGTDRSSDDVSDSDLRAFLQVSQEIKVIRDEYAAEIADADDEEDILSLQEDASAAMEEEVESADIDLETYRETGYLIHDTDELMDRLESIAAED